MSHSKEVQRKGYAISLIIEDSVAAIDTVQTAMLFEYHLYGVPSSQVTALFGPTPVHIAMFAKESKQIMKKTIHKRTNIDPDQIHIDRGHITIRAKFKKELYNGQLEFDFGLKDSTQHYVINDAIEDLSDILEARVYLWEIVLLTPVEEFGTIRVRNGYLLIRCEIAKTKAKSWLVTAGGEIVDIDPDVASRYYTMFDTDAIDTTLCGVSRLLNAFLDFPLAGRAMKSQLYLNSGVEHMLLTYTTVERRTLRAEPCEHYRECYAFWPDDTVVDPSDRRKTIYKISSPTPVRRKAIPFLTHPMKQKHLYKFSALDTRGPVEGQTNTDVMQNVVKEVDLGRGKNLPSAPVRYGCDNSSLEYGQISTTGGLQVVKEIHLANNYNIQTDGSRNPPNENDIRNCKYEALAKKFSTSVCRIVADVLSSSINSEENEENEETEAVGDEDSQEMYEYARNMVAPMITVVDPPTSREASSITTSSGPSSTGAAYAARERLIARAARRVAAMFTAARNDIPRQDIARKRAELSTNEKLADHNREDAKKAEEVVDRPEKRQKYNLDGADNSRKQKAGETGEPSETRNSKEQQSNIEDLATTRRPQRPPARPLESKASAPSTVRPAEQTRSVVAATERQKGLRAHPEHKVMPRAHGLTSKDKQNVVKLADTFLKNPVAAGAVALGMMVPPERVRKQISAVAASPTKDHTAEIHRGLDVTNGEEVYDFFRMVDLCSKPGVNALQMLLRQFIADDAAHQQSTRGSEKDPEPLFAPEFVGYLTSLVNIRLPQQNGMPLSTSLLLAPFCWARSLLVIWAILRRSEKHSSVRDGLVKKLQVARHMKDLGDILDVIYGDQDKVKVPLGIYRLEDDTLVPLSTFFKTNTQADRF